MEPFKLPGDEEIGAAYEEGKEAVVALFHRTVGMGKRVFILVWDNASWHISRIVKDWISQHNRCVKQTGQGVRIFVCPLPTKSPWLNPIEPKWVHGKRRIMEPDRALAPCEVEERVCAALSCSLEDHLSISEIVS